MGTNRLQRYEKEWKEQRERQSFFPIVSLSYVKNVWTAVLSVGFRALTTTEEQEVATLAYVGICGLAEWNVGRE